MKKTVLSGKQWILKELLKAGIHNFINGKIYKDNRPADSKSEDIVINSLTMTNEYLQNGVFNVNCYVPKKAVNISGKVQYHKDNKRLQEIAEKVYSVLGEVWAEDYNFSVVNHQDFEDNGDNYYNFRISLNAYP